MKRVKNVLLLTSMVTGLLGFAGCGGGHTKDEPGELEFVGSSFSATEDGQVINAVRLRRINGADRLVTVTIQLTNGTATGGPPPLNPPSDYDQTPIVVTWDHADIADKIVPIPVLNDSLVEGDETISLTLTNPTAGAVVGVQSTATFTIVNDDHAGVIEFAQNGFSVTENGTVIAPVTVRRTGGDDGIVHATITLSNGTATGGSPIGPGIDYDNTPIVVEFQDQDSADKVINVPVFDDHLIEANETVNLALGSPTGGATIGPVANAALQIFDDDSAGTLQFTQANYLVNENGIPVAAVTVSRIGGNDGIVTATVILSNGTATGGVPPLAPPADYDATPVIVTFQDQQDGNIVVTIPILDDHVVEANETVNLQLANPTNGALLGPIANAVLTIVDNDVGGALSFASATFSQNEDGTNANYVRVRRTGGQDGVVTATITMSNGTATGGPPPMVTPTDFDNTPIVVVFNDQDVADKLVPIPILDDHVVEANETFNVALGSPTGGATIGAQASAVFTIVNDDFAGQIAFVSATASVDESGTVNQAIVVRRSQGNDGVVSATITFTGGTATGGAPPLAPPTDYNNTPIVVTWSDQDTTDQTVTVPVLDDHVVEADETVVMTLGAPTGSATIGAQATSTLTIVNNDFAGALSFTSALYTVREDGTPVTAITLRRTGGVAGQVSTTVATVVGGTATGGAPPLISPVDYDQTPILVTWGDQDGADKVIAIPVLDDTLDEQDETVFLGLISPTGGATVGAQSTCVLTILDDDGPGEIALSAAAFSYSEDGTAVVAITIVRNAGNDGQVSATITATDGTANSNSASSTEPVDYTMPVQVITFADQDTTPKTVLLTLNNDLLDEPTETFTVTLSAVIGGATLGLTTATVSIADNDAPAFFGSPTPLANARFGTSLAKCGTRVAVGANGQDINATPGAGAVYVFDAATLTHTLTLSAPNLSTQGGFGGALASAGDEVVVGAPGDNLAAANSGTVYVFNTVNGTMRLAIQDPGATTGDAFGSAVATFGNQIVFVSATGAVVSGQASAGRVYAFNLLTGAQIYSLTKPGIPGASDLFGASLTVVGSRLVVGATGDDLGAVNSGAAYVFDAATGVLQLVLPNPFPASGGGFGSSAAGLGNDIFVGAPTADVPGVAACGRVFGFDGTTGNVTQVIANLVPRTGAQFGAAITAYAGGLAISAPITVVGSPDGEVALFTAAGVWTGSLTLLANPNARFGSAVLDFDGTLVIGASGSSSFAATGGAIQVITTLP